MPVTEQDTRRRQILPDDTARVRQSDPITSHEAADSNDVKASQRYVLETLQVFGPLADHELVEFYEAEKHLIADLFGTFSPSRLRTARKELVEAGLVEFTGKHTMTDHGCRAQVWAVAS